MKRRDEPAPRGGLRAEGVCAGYGPRDVVRDADLELAPGAGIVALAGPNGSGKSTLLRCLYGAVAPRRGDVTLDGRPVRSSTAAQLARRVAAVPQESVMPFDFTVGELVEIGARTGGAGRADGDTHRERARRAMDDMDLARLADRSVVTLSGGERQRAAIARALAQETPYLLLDEPTAHLDPRHQSQLFDALRRRAREHGCAILVVLHDLNTVLTLADRAVLMREGRVARQGPPHAVLDEETLRMVYDLPLRRLTATTGEVAIALPRAGESPGHAP